MVLLKIRLEWGWGQRFSLKHLLAIAKRRLDMNNIMAKMVMLAALGSMAVAADGPSISQGKELFRNPQLGATGKSCNSCHPGGKGLEQAAEYPDEKLAKVINRCIKGPLKGKDMKLSSNEIKSLMLYVKNP
jgi:cytochrome c peroxidase